MNPKFAKIKAGDVAYEALHRMCWLIIACAMVLVSPQSHAQTNGAQFRAFWADAWHDGFQTPEQVSKLVTDLRAANCNAVFVEVRRRGDAYYQNSALDATAEAVKPDFDPLADVIQKAHDTTAGPRIEVHAWFVTYPATTIMRLANKAPIIVAKQDEKHPFNQHPDWLDESEGGQISDGTQYFFDPGHPAVQKYLFDVAMDIITRYDIDGFHFDHARYPGNGWGYNKTSVARFNRLYNRTGKPLRNDPDWLQFRRSQITALIRKVYLAALEAKPALKISASTVTWAPGVTSDAQWLNSAAYKDVLQDWRGWMEEGILDMNVPMVFFKQTKLMDVRAEADWCNYAKDHQYNRSVVIGQASYLSTPAEMQAQVKLDLQSSPNGNKPAGIALYSYATPSKDEAQRKAFFAQLTNPTNNHQEATRLFSSSVPTPEIPWKTKPATGHLRGYVVAGSQTNTLDGARITLTGPTQRKLVSDATGFFGAVDLTPGSYVVTTSFAGSSPVTNACSITAGTVAKLDVILNVAQTGVK